MRSGCFLIRYRLQEENFCYGCFRADRRNVHSLASGAAGSDLVVAWKYLVRTY